MQTTTTDRFFTLYGLKEFGDKPIRYVGITSQSLRSRLTQHLNDFLHPEKQAWFAILYPSKPEIVPLAIELTLDEAKDLERQLIKGRREQGFNLLNRSNGGEGVPPDVEVARARHERRAKRARQRREVYLLRQAKLAEREKRQKEFCQAVSEASQAILDFQAKYPGALESLVNQTKLGLPNIVRVSEKSASARRSVACQNRPR